MSYQPPESSSLVSTWTEGCAPHQEGCWVRMPGQSEPCHQRTPRATWQSDLGSLSLPLSPPRRPFPIKSLVLAHVSPQTIHFQVLDKSPLAGPGSGPPSWVHECCSVRSDPATPWTVVHQASPSMGFSRQEHWSGWPCSPPGGLPNPGIEPSLLHLLHCRQILYCWAARAPHHRTTSCNTKSK